MKTKMLLVIAVLPLLVAFLFLGKRMKNVADEDKLPPDEPEFASLMVEFSPSENNPVFRGTGTDTWDKQIRERGYILVEDGIYKMWYTGYNLERSDSMSLGYATSGDGINWTRYSDEPIFSDKWTEDVFVIRHDGLYYMFAEGRNDIAHLLTSEDGIQWEEQGDLVILDTSGVAIPYPYGTPTVWIEDGHWYLFYERNDLGIWLAEPVDRLTWKNVQDEPVLEIGPESYDEAAVAANQVVSYGDRYYLYYHGSANPDWVNPDVTAIWTSNVAVSDDLLHWTKYPGNPIVEGDHSSPILVPEGDRFRLYTMHDQAWLYEPR